MSLIYLPSWIISAVIWGNRMYINTNVGIIILIHLITGLSLASFSLFVSTPFSKYPQLGAIVATFLPVLLAYIFNDKAVLSKMTPGGMAAASFFFPPAFFLYAYRVVIGFEGVGLATKMSQADPDTELKLLPIIISGLVNFLVRHQPT